MSFPDFGLYHVTGYNSMNFHFIIRQTENGQNQKCFTISCHELIVSDVHGQRGCETAGIAAVFLFA